MSFTETVPIIRLGPNLLITLQGDLDDAAVLRLEMEITHEVARTHAAGVLIDLSGLTIVDSFIARIIARVASMIRLLGAETVVVGIQPAVAITLIELGLTMGHVLTALNATEGIALLMKAQSEL